MDGDQIVFTTGAGSGKGRALRRDPRISLVIQDERPPFSFVTIEGNVTISEDLSELKYWAGRLGARYMGADKAEAYAERNGVPGEFLVRVTVRRVSAYRDIAA
jgi:PPOX class probable F420-dependent enzyme